ncbi:T9SS type A sorting domain-containing protein [Flavobacterium sp. MFBS3-15]|uniref:T9SS type A sorting domain-containing protein n=1 Tax=Flavobacterium sp. MFBS3-15 TaxID=2989816 RepID=UPI002235A891|nr:T9SS type A sorting domain-containing protein [Flavobacterium sp. MFBS3-15]MCW4469286.1 T9SS type A sorting domain-containing protein [Flavobacterium sp. MFBS3-15]
MKKLLFFQIITVLCLTNLKAQTVSTFLETDSNGCYGLTIDENFLYVVSSFTGKVHKKSLTVNDSAYETFNIGGSGYTGICKVGDYVYLSKPYNGSAGIYRFDSTQSNISLENFINLNQTFGLAFRNNELYISVGNKIYKVNLGSSPASLVQIASGITGVGGINGSTIGLKVYDDFLYIAESTGISKINLGSGNYEKETITTHTGTSFAKGDNDIFYLTGGEINNAVYELNLQTQTYSLLATIDNFIGTYDIVFNSDTLFVTTQEGDYNKVAKIDLENLNTGEFLKRKSILFPNPTTTYITLSNFEIGENISIVTPNGQIIKSFKIDSNKVDVSYLEAGIYFIKSGNVYNRFIKN